MSDLEQKLEGILRQDAQAAARRHGELYDAATAFVPRPIVLVGAGLLGRRTLTELRRAGVHPIAFADNYPERPGPSLEGLPVVSVVDAVRAYPQAAFVVTIYNGSATRNQLALLGVTAVHYSYLYFKYSDTLLPYFNMTVTDPMYAQANAVRQAYRLWADEESREEYVAQVSYRHSLDSSLLTRARPASEIYFAPDLFTLTDHEVFIDCGGFDGDSLRALLEHSGGSFKRAVEIEPDPRNYAKLIDMLSTLPPELRSRVIAYRCALAAASGAARGFRALGTISSAFSDDGDVQVEIRALDELLADVRPTFVKMDIEGAEPDALRGARRIAAAGATIWAVCLYHSPDHLWSIPLLLQSLSPNLQFFLRRYVEDCWELVLYGVPTARLRKKERAYDR